MKISSKNLEFCSFVNDTSVNDFPDRVHGAMITFVCTLYSVMMNVLNVSAWLQVQISLIDR